MNFSWTKALGFGALIWLIMFALVSAMVGFKIYDSTWMQIIAALVAGVLAYLFALAAQPPGSVFVPFVNVKVRLFLSSCLTSEAMLSLKEGLVHLTPCKNPILIRKWEKGTIILSDANI